MTSSPSIGVSQPSRIFFRLHRPRNPENLGEAQPEQQAEPKKRNSNWLMPHPRQE